MNCPDQRRNRCHATTPTRFDSENLQELFREKEERDRRGCVQKNVRDVIRRRPEYERAIFERVGEALERAVKV